MAKLGCRGPPRDGQLARACQACHRMSKTCNNLLYRQNLSEARQNLSKLAKTRQNSPKPAKTCQNSPKLVRTRQNSQKLAKTCRKTRINLTVIIPYIALNVCKFTHHIRYTCSILMIVINMHSSTEEQTLICQMLDIVLPECSSFN